MFVLLPPLLHPKSDINSDLTSKVSDSTSMYGYKLCIEM